MSETFDNDIAESVDHLFRQRAGQMIAVLTRLFGVARLDDIEDVVQEAMIQALRQWPLQGQPDNPAAWLIQTAKNRMLDRLRRAARLTDAAQIVELPAPDVAGQVSFTHEIADDQLRMIFICCHPLIPADSRIALTLKIVSGFSVREIARAFLAGEPAIARMLSRAKLQLRERHISLEMPAPEHLP
ncbi:MAG: sigma-70 family RNA polymerase sigma factor, partial [Blastocatellia bacterium]